MAFDIGFRDDVLPGSSVGDAAIVVDIVLGEETDAFESFIGYWSPADYRRQWREGLARVALDGRPSCLIASIEDPRHVVWWYLLHPFGETVRVRHALYLPDERGPFPTHDPYSVMPAYDVHDDEGHPVSEWRVPRQDLIDFLDSTGRAGG